MISLYYCYYYYHFHCQSAIPKYTENVHRPWREAGMLINCGAHLNPFLTPVYKYVWSLGCQVSPLNWGCTIKANLDMSSNKTPVTVIFAIVFLIGSALNQWSRYILSLFQISLTPPSPQKRGKEWSQLKVGARKNWALETINYHMVILLTVVAYENF